MTQTPTQTFNFRKLFAASADNIALIEPTAARDLINRDQDIVATVDDVETGCKGMLGSVMASSSVLGLYDFSPFLISKDTVIIPVTGVLVSNCPISIPSIFTGYEYIRDCLEKAQSAGYINSVAIVIDSFGGMAQGCFELASYISSLKGSLRVEAFVRHNACSAAYAIASSCQKITVSPSSTVGSIGVISQHYDMSQYYQESGMKITLISAPEGGHKADGNPYTPLSDETRERIQASVNYFYDQFVSRVADGRHLSREAVKATNADVFTPDKALKEKLIDAISTDIDAALMGFIGDVDKHKGDEDMSNDEKTAVSKDTAVKAVAAAGPEEKKASASVAKTEDDAYQLGYKAGVKAAATTERERIKAIKESDVAKDRPQAAETFAMETDMPADAAIKLLSQLPVEQKAENKTVTTADANAQANQFAAAVRKAAPAVEAGADASAVNMTPEDTAAKIVRETKEIAQKLGL